MKNFKLLNVNQEQKAMELSTTFYESVNKNLFVCKKNRYDVRDENLSSLNDVIDKLHNEDRVSVKLNGDNNIVITNFNII